MIASRRDRPRRPFLTSGQKRRFALSVLGWGALVALGLACSSAGDTGPGPNATELCTSAYGARCGAACADDAACGGGLFCSFGACAAECTPSAGCAEGQSCGPYGRCVSQAPPAMTPTVPPSMPAPPATVPMTCPQDIKVTFRRETPDVVVLVDQSGSMGCPLEAPANCVENPLPGQVACRCEEPPPGLEPGDPETRWSQLRAALLAETGPIFRLQGEVNFGLTLYGDTGNVSGDTCPAITSVGVKPNNFAAIKAAYEGATTKSGTPTPQGLQSAVDALEALPGENPKYVVLATDGNPGSCDCNELIQTDCNVDPQWRQAVEGVAGAAFAGGVTTFVIGVGKGQVDPSHLQRLALKGQGLPETTTEQKFFEVGTAPELVATFNAITQDVRSCVIALDATVDAADATKGTVTLDGQKVPYGDANGWRLVAPNDKIEFLGSACAQVKVASTQIGVTFECGSNVTPKPPR